MTPSAEATESPAAAAKAAVAKNPAAKKTTKKKKVQATDAAKAKAAILKDSGKKPRKEHKGTLPFLPSGSVNIDDLIGGTLLADGTPKCPGYPRKHITEVYGPEGSGKTTLALEAIAACQKAGGWAMFLDFEHALDTDYAKAVGVSFNEDKLLFYEPESIEEGFRYMYIGICYGVDLIVLDSVAAMVSAKEMMKNIDKAEQIGVRAKALSERLPKLGIWLNSPKRPARANSKKKHDGYYTNTRGGTAIMFINQTRMNIQTSGKGAGGSETTPGGKALKFFAYLRLRATRIKTENRKERDPFTGEERNQPFGALTQIKVVKSKIDRKTGATRDVFIRYGKGIDDTVSIIEAGVHTKLIKKEGSWFTMPGGLRTQGREKLCAFLEENPKAYKELREMVMSAVHSKSIEQPVEVDDLDEDDEILASLDAELGNDEDPEEDLDLG